MAAGCTVTECTIIDPLVKNHLLTTFSSLAVSNSCNNIKTD